MTAEMGHNNPPADDGLDDLRKQIDDAYGEARLWLDGERVANQDQADALATLYGILDKAGKLAESERKAAKQPHLDAGEAVDAAFKPLVDKADKARKAVKLAIQRWNDDLAEIQRKEAERVRLEALAASEAALKLAQEAAQSGNLSDMEAAEQEISNAAVLADMAKKAEGAKAVTRAEGVRGIGSVPMRWNAYLVDAKDALAHYRATQPEALKAWLLDQAQKDTKAGSRVIPGFVIKNEKVG